MATWNLTWVERGTNNAACLGHDEKGLTGDSREDVLADVLHHAEECGIDMDRYEPVLDEVVSIPSHEECAEAAEEARRNWQARPLTAEERASTDDARKDLFESFGK